jgi:hypothetical protein
MFNPLLLDIDANDILNEGVYDAKGQSIELHFPWLQKKNKVHSGWSNTVMGECHLTPGYLKIVVNSKVRVEKAKRKFKTYLGDKATLESVQSERPTAHLSEVANENGKAIPTISPEMLEQMVHQHWENWFYEPIPALQNKTPLEASKTKGGRQRLEQLLHYYETMSAQTSDNVLNPDIEGLRKKLGLSNQFN